MSAPGHLQRFVGKVSATLELTCHDYECSSVTELLQIQPTSTSPLELSGSPGHPAPWKTGCAWHYDSASKISSTKVSDHVQHLLSLFLPIKSRMEEMRPPPHINISVRWECTDFGVKGLTGPEFKSKDVKGMAELGARLVLKVIQKDEIPEG
jgi:hypothetical protein